MDSINNTSTRLFLEKLSQSVQNQTFIKLTLSKPKHLVDLKNIYVRLIEIKNTHKLSFTFRYTTRDEVKNHDFTEGYALIEAQLGSIFLNAILLTSENDISLVFNKKGENPQMSIKKTSLTDTSLSKKEGNDLLHIKKKNAYSTLHNLIFMPSKSPILKEILRRQVKRNLSKSINTLK